MSKKKGGTGLTTVIVLVVIGVLTQVPAWLWFLVLGGGALWLIYRAVSKSNAKVEEEDASVRISVRTVSRSDGYRIPSYRDEVVRDDARWVGPDETVTVGPFTLSNGYFYFGKSLKAYSGGIEPALINPRLKIAETSISLSDRLMGYWPAYREISPEARRAYLEWQAGGRCEPKADIGYVFLFFYGIERRVLVDAVSDPSARSEIPALLAEVERLLAIYGPQSASFRNYAGSFLEFVRVKCDPRLLDAPPEVQGSSYEMPLGLRVALGRMAVEQRPVPCEWAYAWVIADPNIVRRTAVTRCARVFKALFRQKYTLKFDEGLVLPKGRTMLRYYYKPASGGLTMKPLSLGLDGIPDVAVMSSALARLQKLVDECAAELDAYSRYLGKNPENVDSFEASILLPLVLWPDTMRAALEGLASEAVTHCTIQTLSELMSRLGGPAEPSKEHLQGLARALLSLKVAMEPDILGGARMPKTEDAIAVYGPVVSEEGESSSSGYRAAAAAVGLLVAVSASDGDISPKEGEWIQERATSWEGLAPSQRARLLAFALLQERKPATLSTFLNKLESLTSSAKRSIARFMVGVAQADGTVTRDEMRILEKIYKNLCGDSQLLYGDLHAGESPKTGQSYAVDKRPAALALDKDRIMVLRSETAEVSEILSGIFKDEENKTSATEVADGAEEKTKDEGITDATGLLGLDELHSAFLRFLVSRPDWSRQDLVSAAADMGLMLDGALEKLNDASFERFNEAIIEGDDPMEINRSVWERMSA